MMPYVLNQQMLIVAFLFAAMVIQRKDLYGLSYLQLEYFAWVQVLPLCMEFKNYWVLKYVTEVSFESWELYAQSYILLCLRLEDMTDTAPNGLRWGTWTRLVEFMVCSSPLWIYLRYACPMDCVNEPSWSYNIQTKPSIIWN